MAAQRFVKARLAIGAGVAAAVIGGSGYFYQAGNAAGGADTTPVAAPGASTVDRAEPAAPSRPSQSSTARKSRAS